MAQYNIAIDYIIGEKVKKNINTAIFWLQKALIKKYLPAADLLGDLMINSLFCPEDCDALFELLRQSSEKGSKNATYILYKCYKEGCFIIPDNEMALKYKKLLSDDN